MADELSPMTLKAIGFVRNEIKQKPPAGYEWVELVSEIVVDRSLTEALDGLEGFFHIVVLYWMHQVVEKEMPLKIHPMRRQELFLVGLFATRSPNRPNRIGETAVRLLEHKGNILRVKGLDALDGTPVLDIKPYIPERTLLDAKVPPWIINQ